MAVQEPTDHSFSPPYPVGPRLAVAAALVLGLVMASPGSAEEIQGSAAKPPHLLVVSWDGTPDWVIDRLLAEGRMPNLATMAARGVRVRHSVTATPSKTAVGHAALWTGCWPAVNGVVNNEVPLAVDGSSSVLEHRRGFDADVLTAEPLFLTAALAGREVVVLSATHSAPPEPHLAALDRAGVSRDLLTVFSGFEHRLAAGRLYDADDLAPVGEGWSDTPPHVGERRELVLQAAESTFYALLYDDPADPTNGFDRVLVRADGRGTGGPQAILHPRAADPLKAEGWSPFFSVRRLAQEGQTQFRLFELAPDGSRLALYQWKASSLEGNYTPERRTAYQRVYAFHDDAFWRYGTHRLGPTLMEGGDGMAEQRLLEIVARDTDLLIAGSRLALEQWGPEVLFHYSPMSDSAGHMWMGTLDPESPAHDPELAARLWPYYIGVFEHLDRWLGELLALAGEETVVALVTDHGMAGTGIEIHLNRVLEKAGLLHRSPSGGIDLARTPILAAEGELFLRLNDQRWAGGLAMTAAERLRALDAAEAALLAVRDPATDRPVIRQIVRPDRFSAEEAARWGISCRRCGDLYLDPAPGYYPRNDLATSVLTRHVQSWGQGNHGFFPERRTMHGIAFFAGPGLRRGVEIPPIRHIDIAPTLAQLIGIPAPAQATGRVLEEALVAPAQAPTGPDAPPAALRSIPLEEDLFAALATARRAVDANPTDAEAAFAAAELLVRLGAPTEALEMLATVCRLEPAGHRGPLLTALVLRDVDRHTEALDLLDQARSAGVEHPAIEEQRILLRLTLDRLEEAQTLAAETIAEYPDHPGLNLATGLALARGTDRGDIPSQRRELLRQQAIDHLGRALEGGVAEPGRVELELGTLLFDMGRAAEARSHLEAAVAASPGSPEAHYRLGQVLRTLGEGEAARRALERFRALGGERDARDHAAKTLGTRLNSIQSLAASNRLDEALAEVDRLLEESPDAGRAQAQRAKILFSLGRRAEAVQAIRRARELLPAYAEHHYLEGFFLLHLGEIEPAARALERALAIDHDLGTAHALLAGIDAERGRLPAAAGHFERAFALGVEDPALRQVYEKVLDRLAEDGDRR